MNHTSSEDGSQEAARIEALERDLDEVVGTMNWQRRVLARLKGVLATCQVENRAPTKGEVDQAMGPDMRMAA